MKKIIFLFLVLFFSCISGQFNLVYSQYSQFNIGAEGGPTIISLRGNDVLDSTAESNVGFTAGIFGQYNFDQMYSLKLAVNYELKGAKYESGNVKIVSNFDYITIPLLFKAAFGEKTKFFVNAGPYLGILLKQDFDITNSGVDTTIDGTDFIKSTDFGISGGIGVIISLSKLAELTFEIRDNIGLTNVSDAMVVNDGSILTNSAGFMVGFSYGIGNYIPPKKKTY